MNRIGRLETALMLVGILLIGSYFRFVGLDWGEGQAIHPDEEFLRQVTAAVALPDTLDLYFDTASSPLNPHNRGHDFFVYGTLPLFLTRAVGEGLDRGCPGATESGEPTPPSLAVRLLAPALLGRPAEECWPGMFSSGTGARMVGRALAALFDLGGLILVFVIGRRLRSIWLGLLSALLYALAVLPIQQAHFFTVDAFTAFFVSATLYLAIRGAQSGGWMAFALGGLTTGLGMACKISVWPLSLLIALAGFLWASGTLAKHASENEKKLREEEGALEEREADEKDEESPHAYREGVARIVVAGIAALVAFRFAQPYAFSGPGFFGLQLNTQWLDNIATVRQQMSGAIDIYHGHQWTNRMPLVFPWINMVFWGLGLPLGLAVWVGWGVAGVDLVLWWRRRGDREIEARPDALLLLWIWCTAYFAYQATQWVKSMRYLLPVYPIFIILGAWLLIRLVCWAWARSWGRGARVLAIGVGVIVLAGALCWALALTSVYRRPHTRIASSRWIFRNVPTAATAHLRTAEGQNRLPLVLHPQTLSVTDPPIDSRLEVDQEADLVEVTLNRVSDPQDDAEPELIRVTLASDLAGEEVLAEASQEVDLPFDRDGTTTVAFPMGAVRLVPGTTYYLLTDVVGGGMVRFSTSVLATEHWDWPPPLRVDGYDPFGGMYRGLSTSSDGSLQLYHDDNLEKRTNLLNWLDEADYIITASNRLYASIPRLPERYPLTMAYYRALFNGQLGFELVGDFTSFLALGPFRFPDQEEPFPIPEAEYEYRAAPISVPLPPAEEAFSVYDHPRVLVFRKTEAYSHQLAEEILDPALLDEVERVTARQVTQGTHNPVFGPQTWAEQRAGGTWSEMFNRQGPLNRVQWLGAAVWYLVAAALGWLAFPVVFAALFRLSDRGYGLARALGLLIVAYLTWLAASLRILPNTRGTLMMAVGILAVVGAAAAWWKRRALMDFLREHWRMILIQEGVFLLLFVAWTLVRLFNPDLWHPVVGGEKPMDFAYLNAVIKSTWFPPYDPWFAGGSMNYYYFGFVLVASLTKLLGIVPSIAYNLALPLFYSLTGGAAFSLAFNLVARRDGRGSSKRAYLAAALAVLFVLVLGNLGEVRLLLNGFRTVAGQAPFDSTIPGLAELAQTIKGAWMVIRGTPLPFRPETPYWDPTRLLPHPAFVEFPAFTFLYGDLHAHMLALPYTLVVLSLALNWARGGYRLRHGWLLSGLIGGLVIGSLLATNTWDYPTYLLVGLGGLALGITQGRAGALEKGQDSLWRRWLLPFAWRAVLLGGLSVLLFLPYLRSYVAPVSEAKVWRGERVPLDKYFIMLGQFLFPLLTLLALEGWRALRSVWRLEDRSMRLGVALSVSGVLLTSLALTLFYVPVAIVVIPVGVAAAILLIDRERPVEGRVLWLLVGLAMALCLGVDLVAVGGDRMNTVFKFYYQVWLFLAIGAAVAVARVAERMEDWKPEWQQVWWAALVILVFCMALFPAMSIPSKLGDRFTRATGPTLDGMAYIQYSRTGDVKGEVDLGPDYEAIVWLLENVEGSPVILEGLGEREYLWGNRVSVYTGLPAVIGWRWHQVQQRMGTNSGDVAQRRQDVQECYRTTDSEAAWDIIQRYDVRYVYVGPYERLYYEPRALAKFSALVNDGRLRIVYNQGGVRIYQVVE